MKRYTDDKAPQLKGVTRTNEKHQTTGLAVDIDTIAREERRGSQALVLKADVTEFIGWCGQRQVWPTILKMRLNW
jgi:hypothetical protein